jgi:hypothetical protein
MPVLCLSADVNLRRGFSVSSTAEEGRTTELAMSLSCAANNRFVTLLPALRHVSDCEFHERLQAVRLQAVSPLTRATTSAIALDGAPYAMREPAAGGAGVEARLTRT